MENEDFSERLKFNITIILCKLIKDFFCMNNLLMSWVDLSNTFNGHFQRSQKKKKTSAMRFSERTLNFLKIILKKILD